MAKDGRAPSTAVGVMSPMAIRVRYAVAAMAGPPYSAPVGMQRSYVPNFHGDTGSTFTARSAVSDSRSFSSRRKESYSAI